MDLATIFLLHKVAEIFALLCMLAGVSMALFFRKNRSWLKIHRLFNSTSVFFLFAGICVAFFVINQQEGEHIAGFHPAIGAITLLIAFLSLIFGFYHLRAKNKIRARMIHRLLGYMALLSIIIALISGLVHAGIISIV